MIRKPLLVAAIAAAVTPAAARASDPQTICAGSDAPGYYACASVTVDYVGGQIVLGVQNLDSWMSPDMTGSETGYLLNGIGLTGFPTLAPDAFAGTFSVGTAGDVWIRDGDLATQGGYWDFSTAIGGSGGGIGSLLVDAGSETSQSQLGALLGCTPAGAPDRYGFRTCAPDFSGYLTFAFDTNLTEAEFNAITWRYSLRGIAGPEGVSFKCGPGFTYDNGTPRECGPPTVTPEPVGLLLMATGLLGVAFVGRRRRRSRFDSET